MRYIPEGSIVPFGFNIVESSSGKQCIAIRWSTNLFEYKNAIHWMLILFGLRLFEFRTWTFEDEMRMRRG